MDDPIYRWTIDRADRLTTIRRIAGVDDGDGAPEPEPTGLLWDAIDDWSVREVYRALLQSVRDEARSMSICYRCDAPDRYRLQRMFIRPLGDRGIEFESQNLETEQREPISLMTSALDDSSVFVVSCSWCSRVQIEPNEWVEIDAAIEALGLLQGADFRMTHSACPDCFNELIKQSKNAPNASDDPDRFRWTSES